MEDSVSTMSAETAEVVVTGIGVVSPIGTGKEEFWRSLREGISNFKEVTLFDTSLIEKSGSSEGPLNRIVAGEITEFDASEFLGKKGLRTMDRSTRLLCVAALLALQDASLQITEEKSDRTGVSVGATYGSLHSISQFDRSAILEGPRFVNPSLFPNTVINSPASHVSIRFNIRGFNTTISTGFCAGLDAIGYAADFIKMRRADVVLAGGVEELCEETLMGFHALGMLAPQNGGTPLFFPFDSRRQGFILSEGAALMVLEERDHAQKRGVTPLSIIAGYSNAISYSLEESLMVSIQAALEMSGMGTEDIDYIASGANSTKETDLIETRVIKRVFGKDAYRVPVSAVKSILGETYSASGAFAVAAVTGALQWGFIPPTLNYNVRDPECDLDYVPHRAREQSIQNALIISTDPYGNASSVVMKRP